MRLSLLLLACAIGSAWASSCVPESHTVSATPAPRPYGLGAPASGYLSSASCAASSCHGRGHAGGTRSEYQTWALDLRNDTPNDPHARAYQVLYNPVSRRIAESLQLPKPAHETPLCLKCHAVESIQPAEAVSEGVGCGACHGPAEKWLSAHYKPAWKKLSNREKWEQYGFVSARNLTARALNCAGCHVGDDTREVNHELIAAGHPRLTFEFAGLHATPGYRKHWQEALPTTEFELRAWVVGQAVSLRNATALLHKRAQRIELADSDADWPEFAGYSCTSCHQAIRKDSPRPVARHQRVRGKPSWEMLSVAAVDVATEYTPHVFLDTPTPRLTALRELREVMVNRNSNPKLVSEKSLAALKELDVWVATLQSAEDRSGPRGISPEVPQRLLNSLAISALTPDRDGLREHDPDFLAAHAAGCRAMLRALPEARLSASVKELVEILPVPHTPNGRLTDWGRGLTNVRLLGVRNQFRDMLERTGTPGGTR